MIVQTYEIILLAFCFLFSAFFSGSEAVLMSISIDRARQLIEEGGKKGKALSFMIEKPNELLTTILVGNNVANILAASLVTIITARFFDHDALAVSVGITTMIILIAGEILPKTLARAHAESISVFVIRVLQFTFYALYPVIMAMVCIIKRVLGENAELAGRIVTKNDLEYMINKAEKEKTMDSKQLDLLTSILEFPTIKVKDIMVPRSKVNYLKLDASYDEVIKMVKENNHSRYPICDGEFDNAIGFFHVRDLVQLDDDEIDHFSLEKIAKPPFFVYEHMKIQAVFDYMNRKKVHLALIKDENGLVVGIVTLEDIVEEILGDIQDEHDQEDVEVIEEYSSVDLNEGINVEGSISLRELYNEYDVKIPLNDNYSTLAGFILDMLGNNFPQTGQLIVWEGFAFELIRVDEYEMKEIRVRHVGGDKHLFSKSEAIDAYDDDDSPVIVVGEGSPDQINMKFPS